jgi:MoxR-like ATPase
MGSLLLVTGPPGAGKSTLARLMADRFEPSALVEGDTFFAFLARGAILPWLPESTRQNEIVTEAAASAAGRYASGGYATVYDGLVGALVLAHVRHLDPPENPHDIAEMAAAALTSGMLAHPGHAPASASHP